MPFVALYRLEGDRIQHSRDYFDLYAVLVQIGALPVPDAEATPAATPEA